MTKYFVKTAYGVQHTYFSMTNDFLLSPISPNISWNYGFEESLLEYLDAMKVGNTVFGPYVLASSWILACTELYHAAKNMVQ